MLIPVKSMVLKSAVELNFTQTHVLLFKSQPFWSSNLTYLPIGLNIHSGLNLEKLSKNLRRFQLFLFLKTESLLSAYYAWEKKKRNETMSSTSKGWNPINFTYCLRDKSSWLKKRSFFKRILMSFMSIVGSS